MSAPRIGDDDADAGRDGAVFTVDEHIEMAVDVMDEQLRFRAPGPPPR